MSTPIFSQELLKRCIMSPEEAAKFKASARRMVYYVHEDGRILLDNDGTTPAAPSLQSVAEAVVESTWCYLKGGSAGTHDEALWFRNNKDAGGPAHCIGQAAAILAPLLAQYEQRARELEGERDKATRVIDSALRRASPNLHWSDLNTYLGEIEAEHAALRTRCAELERDKARIDRIEKAERCIMCLHNEAKNRAVWSVTFENQSHTEYDTLREAMDALAADEDRAARTKETTP